MARPQISHSAFKVLAVLAFVAGVGSAIYFGVKKMQDDKKKASQASLQS